MKQAHPAPLEPAQAQMLRGLLQARYRTTLKDIELRLQQDGRANLDALREWALDEGDVAVGDLLAETAIALLDREVNDLREVETALQRLGAEVITQCADCGGTIPFERLVAYPTAQRCIECQRRHEHSAPNLRTPSL